MHQARDLGVEGRSKMTKDELVAAVEQARALVDVRTVADHLGESPGQHTVSEISDATGLDSEVVRAVLDEWRPAGAGEFEHVGPGGGGPWVVAQPSTTYLTSEGEVVE